VLMLETRHVAEALPQSLQTAVMHSFEGTIEENLMMPHAVNLDSGTAGLIDLRLDYDATSNNQIWDQLLELMPVNVIQRVRVFVNRGHDMQMLHAFRGAPLSSACLQPPSTLPSAWLQGSTCIAKQEKVIANIVAKSFIIQLGGAEGGVQGWGKCLATRGDSATNLRSQIGNVLAAKSQAAGLRAIGAVIYVEVSV
jgi:hypothetical protein